MAALAVLLALLAPARVAADGAPVCPDPIYGGITSSATPLDLPPPPCTDFSGHPLTVTIVSPPQHGVLTGPNAAGHRTYTSFVGFVGQDSFTFKVSNGTFDSNVATVNIDVTDAANLHPSPTPNPTPTPTPGAGPSGPVASDPGLFSVGVREDKAGTAKHPRPVGRFIASLRAAGVLGAGPYSNATVSRMVLHFDRNLRFDQSVLPTCTFARADALYNVRHDAPCRRAWAGNVQIYIEHVVYAETSPVFEGPVINGRPRGSIFPEVTASFGAGDMPPDFRAAYGQRGVWPRGAIRGRLRADRGRYGTKLVLTMPSWMTRPPWMSGSPLQPTAPILVHLMLGATVHRAAAEFLRLAGCSHRKLHFQFDLTTTAGQTATITASHACRR